jgi:Zn-dependent protease
MDFSPWVVLSVVLQFAIVLLSLSVHESAHAWAADRLGDSTGRMLGRITLNPWPHIDLIGTILLPVLLAFAGLPVFGWAKPVPVITRNFRHMKRDMALVGVAGPASNLLMAAGVTVVLGVSMVVMGPAAFSQNLNMTSVLKFSPDSPLEWVAMVGAINIVLASFNLIPLPPLDGSWVLGALLPRVLQPLFDGLRRFGPVLLLFLFLSRAINYLLIPVFLAIFAALMIFPLTLLRALLGG